MENTSNNISELCANGCGFYGNPAFNNLCSKCFNEKEKDKEASKAELLIPSVANQTKPTTPHITEKTEVVIDPPSVSSPSSQSSNTSDSKTLQKNKGRCFSCKAKVPLAKQTINKCRCDLVFCDSHRYPEKHDCSFDYINMEKDLLKKKNPKLNERHTGGRSFNRIDD